MHPAEMTELVLDALRKPVGKREKALVEIINKLQQFVYTVPTVVEGLKQISIQQRYRGTAVFWYELEKHRFEEFENFADAFEFAWKLARGEWVEQR